MFHSLKVLRKREWMINALDGSTICALLCFKDFNAIKITQYSAFGWALILQWFLEALPDQNGRLARSLAQITNQTPVVSLCTQSGPSHCRRAGASRSPPSRGTVHCIGASPKPVHTNSAPFLQSSSFSRDEFQIRLSLMRPATASRPMLPGHSQSSIWRLLNGKVCCRFSLSFPEDIIFEIA